MSNNCTIVIPAFNEEKRIVRTIQKLIHYIEKHNAKFEIIVVDDGSTDATIQVIKENFNNLCLIISLEQNCGKGRAVATGVLHAQTEYILFCDADGSTPFREIETLFAAISDSVPIVIGSRAIIKSDSKVKTIIGRKIVGRIFSFCVRCVTGLKFKDTQCGFKLMKKVAAHKIFSKVTFPGFSFDVEALYLAKKYGYEVAEVSVAWAHVHGSKVSIVKDSLRMFRDIILIRWNDLRGIYK